MGTKKASKPVGLIAATIALLFSFLPADIFSQSEWVNFASGNQVRTVRVFDDTLWLTTSGGLLAITGSSQEPIQFQNQDGLGSNDLYDIIADNANQKWVAAHGRLVKFSSSGSVQYLVRDIDNNFLRMYRLVDEDDQLWVGTSIGLVLFSKTLFGGQILDSYTLFGGLNPEPAVLDIALDGDSIWLATTSGLAVADKSNPSMLKAPANWTTFDVGNFPELGNDTVNSIVINSGIVYVTTPKGLFTLQRGIDTSFVPIDLGSSVRFARTQLESDTVFYYYSTSNSFGYGFLNGTTLNALPSTGLPATPLSSAAFKSARWLGTGGDGVYHNTSGEFELYETGLLPGNDISDLVVDASGQLTAGVRRKFTIQSAGNDWITRPYPIISGTTDYIIDSSGNIWGGSNGTGLWLIGDDTVINYDETNSTMIGNNEKPPVSFSFVYINGLATGGNVIFTSCYKAVTGYPIAFGDLSDLDNRAGWDSLGITDSITDIETVDLDYYNQTLAIASENSGVFSYYLGPDPYDRADDSIVNYREGFPYYLISDETTIVKYAPDGSLWVGTNLGLCRLDMGVDRFDPVLLPSGFGPEIRALEFDSRGGAWVGAVNGLVKIDPLSSETTLYTELNSGLVSDRVNGIFFHPSTGRLYVATEGGISYLPSQIGEPTSDIEQVVPFPNPFVINSSVDRVGFNYSQPASLNIFNVAGESVREMDLTIEGWDGRNQSGQMVASGVYIYLLTGEDGSIGKGKLLLVRQ